MKPSPPDITTDRRWLEKQQHRLLGFEILRDILHVRPNEMTPFDIQERTGVDKGTPNQVYQKRFLPRLLKELGASDFDGALAAIRRLRDRVH